jgi:hypothetical protein
MRCRTPRGVGPTTLRGPRVQISSKAKEDGTVAGRDEGGVCAKDAPAAAVAIRRERLNTLKAYLRGVRP